MKKIIMLFFFFSLLITAGDVWAEDKGIRKTIFDEEIGSAFRSFFALSPGEILVPTVVEVPVRLRNDSSQIIAVVEKSSGKLQPYLLLSKGQGAPKITASDSIGSKEVYLLSDGSLKDYVEYQISSDQKEQSVVLEFNLGRKIATSSLTIHLDNYVALPQKIEVKAGAVGNEKVVVAEKRLNTRTINFPQTEESRFLVKLSYSQPLRIREITFNSILNNADNNSSLRFLAQPKENYEIYFDADRYVSMETSERPNLLTNEGVRLISTPESQSNPLYVKADSDKDGVPDENDNCVSVENSDQEDINGNGRGDSCDDFDRDGIINSRDNCPNQPNRNQKDVDLDGLGDVCDDKENRVLQNLTWLPMVAIVFVSIVVGGLLIVTLKRK